MRNLKRALSLTLASVMLLGMMVVGSSAAAGYDDVKDTDNVEAIEVLQAVEVMVGDERGFGPDRPVTRNEMAVVMGKLLNLDYNYYASTCPFTDVATWARGWVGACYANGIVSGRGGTIYDGEATVTAVEAASMIMRALGYFKYAEDYADGFQLSTVRQGSDIGIFSGVGTDGNTPMTRNQVAQMALNALRSNMVTFTGTPGIEVNGVKVGYRAEYTPRTGTENKYNSIASLTTTILTDNGQYFIQLGEQLYDGNLKLNDNTIDTFGRPARYWEYNSKEIGTYAKTELMVEDYDVKVSGRDLYELLGQSTIRDNDLDSYLDGAENGVAKNELVRSNTTAVNNSARGVLTEVYLDNSNDRITIVSINTYLARANSDYNAESETASVTVYNSQSGISKLIDLEDVPGIEDIKRDDWMLVQWADGSKNAIDKVVVDAFDVEILKDSTVTKFSMDRDEDSSNYPGAGIQITALTTGGNEYKNNVNAYYKASTLNDYHQDLLVDKTYNIFLDQFGNFIGAELHTGKDQYVFITGYDRPTSAIAVSTATANAIFTDGTMKNIKVNVKDTNKNITASGDANYSQWAAVVGNAGKNHEEMWYSYTVRDDVYTLTPAVRYTYQKNNTAADAVIDTSNVRLVHNALNGKGTGYSYGEDESVYITVKMGDVDTTDDNKGIDEVNGTYTGVQDVKLVYSQNDWVHAVYDEDNFIIAAIVLGEAEGIVDNYAYILGKTDSERYEDGVHYWTFDAIIGGEKKTMTVEDRFGNTVQSLKQNTIQELVLNNNGNVVTIRDLPNSRTSATSEVERNSNIVTPYENDKIYTNHDYIAGAATDSQDHADYNAYLIDIGGAFPGNLDRYGAAAIGTSTVGSVSGQPYVDLAISGRTLHYNRSLNDMGLLFGKDAPAFVRQRVNGEWETYTYGSVAEAFGRLQDADADTTNNSSTGEMKQFSGIVAAVLDSKGVAQWVFFNDNTPINSKGGNFDGFQGRGVHVTAGETVTEVNRLLAAGNDVTVDGSWMPDDAILAGIRPLRIPAGRTLYINGDFDTTTASWGAAGDITTTNCAAGSSIVVNGTFTGDQVTARNIACNLTASNIVLQATANNQTFNISGNVQTTDATNGDLDIVDVTGPYTGVTINMSGNVSVKGAIDGNGQARTLNISGHVESANVNVTATGTVVVTSVSSLIVTGNVVGKVYLNNTTGVAANTSGVNGYVNIGGTVTEFYNYNCNQSASRTPVIGTATGTYVAGANTKTIVTGTWNPTNATLNAGSTIEFQGSGKATGDAAKLFVNASNVQVDTTNKTITVGATAATKTNSSVSNAVTVAGDTTPTWSITNVTFDETNPAAPVMKVTVKPAGGVELSGNTISVLATVGEKTAYKAIGTSAESDGTVIAEISLTGTGNDKLNLTLAAGTAVNISLQLKSANDGTGENVGTAFAATYSPKQTYSVTVSSGDKIEFYTPGTATAGPAKIGQTTSYVTGTKILVKLAQGVNDYRLNTTGLTAEADNFYSLTLTENVKGAANDNSLLVAVFTVAAANADKVEIYKSIGGEKQTENFKVDVNTVIYLKLASGNQWTADGARAVTAVEGQTGWYQLTVTEDVTPDSLAEAST